MYKYSLEMPMISDETLDFMHDWCDTEFGTGGWSWYLGSYVPKGLDIFYFDDEEDKVKFILRWL